MNHIAINPLRGEAALVTPERTFRLRLDVNAFCCLETALGRTTAEALEEWEARPDSITMLRALVWAGLQHEHECDLDEAGVIASDAGKGAVAAVNAALSAAFGVAEGGDKADPRKPPIDSGTG